MNSMDPKIELSITVSFINNLALLLLYLIAACVCLHVVTQKAHFNLKKYLWISRKTMKVIFFHNLPIH